MNPEMSSIALDAGYDSFEIHADIRRLFGSHPLIQFREDAIVHSEGTMERIDHRVDKIVERRGATLISLSGINCDSCMIRDEKNRWENI